MLSLADELDVHTWLQSTGIRGGKLHAVYRADAPLNRFHYMRFDLTSGRREVDLQPFQGERLRPRTLQGHLLADPAHPGSTIYYVSSVSVEKQTRLCCLASDDDGDTWYDYAVSEEAYRGEPLNVGGCRSMTADRQIIGSFTEFVSKGRDNRVFFYRIPLGLARAELTAATDDGATKTFRFGATRGQPEQVRFRAVGGEWSEWLKFSTQLTARLAVRPAEFQLRSRLGVESSPEKIAPSNAAWEPEKSK